MIMRRSMRSFTLRSRTLADASPLAYESLKATVVAESSPSERECMLNMYTVSTVTVILLQNPQEYEGILANPRGAKTNITLVFDGVKLYVCKRLPPPKGNPKSPKPPPQSQSQSQSLSQNPSQLKLPPQSTGRAPAALQSVLFEIMLKCIVEIQRTIYDKKKFYIWHLDAKNTKVRVDIELISESIVNELIAKIRFIQKSVCGTSFLIP
jgi:hypothetical protein